MKKKLFLLFFGFVFWFQFCEAQSFEIENGKDKFSVYFKHIGNLIILPISINGSVPLNFLLDTGSPYTIITNLNAIRHFELKKGNSITVSGLGRDIQNIEAYLSTGNSLTIGKAASEKSEIILIYEQGFDLSGRFGIPIYGIIGHDILKDFITEINYSRKKVTFYEPDYFHKKKNLKKFESVPIEVRGKKPYLNLASKINEQEIRLDLLIDSGSSDALWLFEKNEENIFIPSEFIEDYLGYGLNGEIHGKKTRISDLKIGSYHLENLTTSFPDSISISNVVRKNRNGTIGSEVLRRFTTIYDYQNKTFYFKKNKYFKQDFHYNLAGLELYQPYPDLPYLEVAYVRKNSPAYFAGLKKGDAIRYVNEKKINTFLVNQFEDKYSAYQDNTIYPDTKKRESITLPEIIELFKSEVGRKINIVYTRGENKEERHAKFVLEKSI